MPKPALLRLIKRWRRYERRGDLRLVLLVTRGIYVLYRLKHGRYEVVYIGVAGVSKSAEERNSQSSPKSRQKPERLDSLLFFEVHDNVLREEILEIESLLLGIFRDDSRIGEQAEEFREAIPTAQESCLGRCLQKESRCLTIGLRRTLKSAPLTQNVRLSWNYFFSANILALAASPISRSASSCSSSLSSTKLFAAWLIFCT